MIRKNLTFLVINKEVVDVFLINHLRLLRKYYQISFISPINSHRIKFDNHFYKNSYINFDRSFNLLLFFSNIFYLIKFLKKNKNNLYISIHPKNGLLLGICKYFYDFTSLHIITGQIWANMKGIKKNFFKIIDDVIFRNNDYLLVDSKSQITFLKENKFLKYNFDCMNNGSISGVDIKKFKKSKLNKNIFLKKNNLNSNSKFILFVGRINTSKGIVLLLDAFNKLIQNKSNYYLLIVGNEEIKFHDLIKKYSDELIEKVLKFDYTDNISFFYSIADIFCLPSYREGFGLSVIEASASKLPVIVSDIYGLNDCMEEKITGLKFKSGNYLSLYNKINYLINNPTKVIKYGKQGNVFVSKNFNYRDVAEFFLKYINKINF